MVQFFKDENVLVLGSAPCVQNVPADDVNWFDVIVRLNNYKFFNSCQRVDVWYSHFGTTIKKDMDAVRRDNPNFLMINYLPEGFGSIYQTRQMWKDAFPYYKQTHADFTSNFETVGATPTIGIAAILDIVRCNPSNLFIAGYDFFSSWMHNIDEPWFPSEANGADHHAERVLVDEMLMTSRIETKPGWIECARTQ